MSDLSAIHRLADFAYGLDLRRVPQAVRRQGALTLLDTVGCMIAGSAAEEAGLLIAAEAGHGANGPASVMGSPLRLPAAAAARINGYMGDIFEINDLTGGHAGIGNVATAIAAAEVIGASGQDLLAALICGVETTTRIYKAFYPHMKPYSECGMVPVGVPSSVGSAAVAGRLFGLDRQQMREALAIAAALSGWCPAETVFGQGSTIKPLLFGGAPASTGLTAARYARAGLTGPPAILESPIGYFATVARTFDADALEDGAWGLAEPRRKLHACCGYIHSAIDAIVRLHAADPEGLDSATSVRVAMPAYVMPAVGKTALPRTANEARFNARYCLALAASGADAIVPDHSERFGEHLAHPAVVRAWDRIEIAADASLDHYHQAVVRLFDAGGQTGELRVEAPRGSPHNPLSDEAVIAKFDGLASPVFGASRAAALRERLLGVESIGALGPLFALLRGDAASEAADLAFAMDIGA
ncbi:MmgE/PrpD family protein [Brevundimonas diminuta]|uniref:MmgE/PrpD family protein n=1 Tax=Brevundimonas diminuta TaxID=293 RepID=UPI003D9A45E7